MATVDKLDGEIAALRDQPGDALAGRWQQVYGCPPPKGMRADLLLSGERYRHYISSRLKGDKRRDNTVWRIPAAESETLATRLTVGLLKDRGSLASWVGSYSPSASVRTIFEAAATTANEPEQPSSSQRRDIIATLVRRIVLRREAIALTVDPGTLLKTLAPLDGHDTAVDNLAHASVTIEHPIGLKRRGNEMRLLTESASSQRSPDAALVNIVARAHFCLDRLTSTPGTRIADVARDFSVDRADVGRILPLAFLSPKLLEQILTGSQPARSECPPFEQARPACALHSTINCDQLIRLRKLSPQCHGQRYRAV